MNILISWSGDRSKDMAEALRIWLPRVIQSVRPWVSSHDLGKGSKWSTVLSSELGSHIYVIICVTPENREKPWLLFEAGALSKTDESRTLTLLLGLGPSDIEQPLAQFNHTVAEKGELRALVRSINEATASPITDDVLTHSFNLNWPYLKGHFDEILAAAPVASEAPGPSPGARGERSMIEELLQLVRAQNGPRRTVADESVEHKEGARIVRGIIQDVLQERGVSAEVAVRRHPQGQFSVNIAFSAGSALGFNIAPPIAIGDIALKTRKLIDGHLLRVDQNRAMATTDIGSTDS